jgi:diadenosine tetraphosphate (Ap4A) HIT family hydrolase
MDAPNRCPFCSTDGALQANELAHVRPDRYPASPGHLLIIPRRHVADFFLTTAQERQAMLDLVDWSKDWIEARFAPDGYNLGVNVGEAAGQTIFHVHLHLIPRFRGDVPRPRGGVRGVIPDKQDY